MESLFVVGLGNPGTKYALTRHNVGKEFAKKWANERAVSFTKQELYSKATCTEGSVSLSIAYPETFMNLSGKAVRSLLKGAHGKSENLLVIVDDLETKLGTCKLVFEGGLKGHNGLRSIYEVLGTKSFYQLRIGIGRPAGDDVAEFVLSPFSEQEKIQIDSMEQEVFHLLQKWIETKSI